MTHCSDYDRSRSVSVTILFLVGCGWLWLIAGACGRMSGGRLSVIGYRRRNPLTELNVKPVRSLRCFKRGAAQLRIQPTHPHTEPALKRAQFDQVLILLRKSILCPNPAYREDSDSPGSTNSPRSFLGNTPIDSTAAFGIPP